MLNVYMTFDPWSDNQWFPVKCSMLESHIHTCYILGVGVLLNCVCIIIHPQSMSLCLNDFVSTYCSYMFLFLLVVYVNSAVTLYTSIILYWCGIMNITW